MDINHHQPDISEIFSSFLQLKIMIKKNDLKRWSPSREKTIETIPLNNDCLDSKNLFSCLPYYYKDLVFLASLACSLI